jgi:hypothetical protein
MPLTFSKFGKQEIQRHSLMPLARAKLYVGEGEELTGHGYSAIDLDLSKWNLETGEYPTLEWIFEADIPAIVGGYYIVNASDEIIMYEAFNEEQEIQHTGDKITIDIQLAPVVKNEVVGK